MDDLELGDENVTWSRVRGDVCCNDYNVDIYYYGCNDSTAPSGTCEDCEGVVCANEWPGAAGLVLPEPDYNAVVPQESYHYAEKFGGNETYPCFDNCVVDKYGFTVSDYTAFSDVTLGTI